jgi:hypothetical protein
MAKWMKVLLGVVLSLAIFAGVAAIVYDMHPLGGGAEAYARQRACLERVQYSETPTSVCYDAYRHESDAVDRNERLVSAGAGVVAVALFWFLLNLLYLRPRRRRNEEEAGAV